MGENSKHKDRSYTWYVVKKIQSENKTKIFVHNLAFGEKLFGRLIWNRKCIKTSLQNLIRGERAQLKHDQENGLPNQ